MTVREILKMLRKDGWYTTSQEGSHISLKHPEKPGKARKSHSTKSQRGLETGNSKQHLQAGGA